MTKFPPWGPHVRLVLLTGDGPEHRYVANQLARAFPIAAHVIETRERVSLAKKAAKLARTHSPAQLVSRLLLKAWLILIGDSTRRISDLHRLLGDDIFKPPPIGDRRHVEGINSPHGVRVLADVDPGLLLVYGTSILRNEALGVPRYAALNLHTGLSPYYRGAQAWFWTIYREDLEHFGVTVHTCTAHVDGGPIVDTQCVSICAGDTVHTAFGRAVKAGAALYVDAVRGVLNHGLTGTEQDLTSGAEYRSAMKGIAQEWQVRRTLRRRVAPRTHVQS